LKTTMQGINASLMDTIAACGDVNRNVMCNPNPYESEHHEEAHERVIEREELKEGPLGKLDDRLLILLDLAKLFSAEFLAAAEQAVERQDA